MWESKFSVIHKKLQKFIKSLAESGKEYYLEYSAKDKPIKSWSKKHVSRDMPSGRVFRSRVLFFNQLYQVSKKNNRHVLKACIPKTKDPHDRVFNFVLKFLNIPHGKKLDIYGEANTFWKSFLPQILKDQKKLRNIFWLRASGEGTIPKFSRGFKANTGDQLEDVKSGMKGKPKVPETAETQKAEELDHSFKRMSEEYNGTAEQKLYTQLSFLAEPGKSVEAQRFKSLKTLPPSHREFEQDLEPETKRRAMMPEAELPPPQRCRLSCPLPPPEFNPPETKEFLPNYQSLPVKFSSQPEVFLPQSKPIPAEENYAMKTPPLEPRPQKIARVTANMPKMLPAKTVTAKKEYPVSTKKYKSQLYEPQPEIIPKMKALLFDPQSLALDFFAVNAPTRIHKDEVLVQVTYSGVCGTDLFITEGKLTCGERPVILGHEISGKVYAAGSDVQHVQPGDNVAVNPYTACCTCRYCMRGFFSCCTNEGINNSIGISKNGGWAEYVVVKKSQVYKVPSELGLDQAALIQPLSCVLSAMSKLNISNGLSILIQGLGLAGCLWASVLHSQGHKNVFVSDNDEKKRAQFQILGLGYDVISPEEIGKYNADIIIECTGSPPSIEKSLKKLNPNGQMCFFGKPNPFTEIRCFPYEIVRKEIRIVGNIGNALCFSKAIDLATDMGNRYLDFLKLGVHVFDLQDYQEAFQLKRSGEVGKIMFKF